MYGATSVCEVAFFIKLNNIIFSKISDLGEIIYLFYLNPYTFNEYSIYRKTSVDNYF